MSGPLDDRARDLATLAGEQLDVLVVGGGIVGTGSALDAATRGLRVGLVERDDIAVGTSSRSSRLIHGGLRYLEQYRFALVREALRERSRVLHLAPHLVTIQPLLRAKPAWLWFVHCETSTGMLNDLGAFSRLCADSGTRLCVDAISSIGTVPVDLRGAYFASGVSRFSPGRQSFAPPTPATPHIHPAAVQRRALFCGKLLSKLGLLPECRADGMADVRDLKSRGDFPRVGSTPTPGTTFLIGPYRDSIGADVSLAYPSSASPAQPGMSASMSFARRTSDSCQPR